MAKICTTALGSLLTLALVSATDSTNTLIGWRNIQGSNHKRSDASASAPFAFDIGSSKAEFEFHVDITQRPHGFNTSYALNWPGNTGLNGSLVPVIGGNAKTDSMCIFSIHGKFTKNMVNRYDVSQPGDCVGPFKSNCVNALKNMYETAVLGSKDCPSLANYPSECGSVFDSPDVVGFTQSSFPFNASLSGQPVTFSSFSTYSPSDELNVYKDELHALQVALFAAKHTAGSGTATAVVQPVCLVVKPESGSANTTTHDGAAGATAMPNVGALALAGIGIVAGML